MKSYHEGAVATMATSAFTGVKILKIENGIDDSVMFCHWNNQSGDGKISKSKIQYDNSSKPYFMSRGQKWYIDDFMRTKM